MLGGPWAERWARLPAPARDSAPAIPVVLFLAISTVARDGAGEAAPIARFLGLSTMVIVLLSLRRRRPRAVWVAALVLSVVVPLVVGDDLAWFIQLTVAAYSVIAFEPSVRAGVVLGWSVAAALAGQAVLVLVGEQSSDPAAFAVPVLALIYPVGLGLAVRANRRHVRELADHAAELERLRGVEAREAVLEERAHIARDLHDVVAHHVSGIVLQAKAARRVVGHDHVQARDALEEIVTSGASALSSMRRLVGMLRDVEGAAPQPYAPQPHASQPTIDELPDLVTDARPGLRTVLHVEGTASPVADEVGLSAYRIVQEALTNVGRHARATCAEVTLGWTAADLEVTVDDDGVGPPGSAEGHGLLGMRERAAMCGGTLEVGPSPAGGCRVRARLPVGPTP